MVDWRSTRGKTEQIEAIMTGFLASLMNWFRVYKVLDGNEVKILPFGENIKDQRSVIRDSEWVHDG